MSGCHIPDKCECLCHKDDVKFMRISSTAKPCCQCDDNKDLSIVERIENLEGYMKMEDRVTDSGILIRLITVEKTITEIVDKIAAISNHYYKEKEKLTPYKCPICDGTGNHPDQTSRLMVMVHTKTGLIICNHCEGKGVLWR